MENISIIFNREVPTIPALDIDTTTSRGCDKKTCPNQ